MSKIANKRGAVRRYGEGKEWRIGEVPCEFVWDEFRSAVGRKQKIADVSSK
jgi:hypothetical protein